jgi:hypothetical protein
MEEMSFQSLKNAKKETLLEELGKFEYRLHVRYYDIKFQFGGLYYDMRMIEIVIILRRYMLKYLGMSCHNNYNFQIGKNKLHLFICRKRDRSLVIGKGEVMGIQECVAKNFQLVCLRNPSYSTHYLFIATQKETQDEISSSSL